MIPIQSESLAAESAYRRSQVARSRGVWGRAPRPNPKIPSPIVRTALYVVPGYSWILR